MALAADTIDDHARHLEPRVIGCAAFDDRGRGLRLAADVDDQQDRQAERRRHIRRGPGAPGLAGNAVEEAHRGFAQSERALFNRLRGERREQFGRHGPGIEIDAFPPRGRRVEGRIDVIRAGLEADHADAASLERAQ